MSRARLVRLGSTLPLLLAALCAACGSDDDDPDEGGRPALDGPAGCYLGAEMRCDCDIEEAACVEEGQTWVEEGCASCAT